MPLRCASLFAAGIGYFGILRRESARGNEGACNADSGEVDDLTSARDRQH